MASSDDTTVAVQRFLDELQGREGDPSTSDVVRALLERSADRLRVLCNAMIQRHYARLSRPPLQLKADELLSSVVERLMKALRNARPGNVRQFFTIANQHMRWELNELARQLEHKPAMVPLSDQYVAPRDPSESGCQSDTRRFLDVIESLPEDDREVFSLVRIHGLTHAATAEVLGVSSKTVQRRLNRSLLQLAKTLSDPRAPTEPRTGGEPIVEP